MEQINAKDSALREREFELAKREFELTKREQLIREREKIAWNKQQLTLSSFNQNGDYLSHSNRIKFPFYYQ